MPRRYPIPWRPVELETAYRIDDANGQPTGLYIYFGDGGAEAVSSGRLTKAEARRLAAWVCRMAAEDAARTAKEPDPS